MNTGKDKTIELVSHIEKSIDSSGDLGDELIQHGEGMYMQTIYFYSANAEYGCFSNFSPHPITIEGMTYPTTEHYFQAQKFLDAQIQKKIVNAHSPHEAALLGRKRDFPLRKDWETMRNEVMLKAIRAKIEQHDDVREMLLSTGNAALVEHTKNDRYWADGGDGSGLNRLGKILMKVREEWLAHR